MGRLILVFAALLLVSRDARARLEPYTRWVLDPGYELVVRSKLGDIAHAIEGQVGGGRPAPTSTEELRHFLRAYFHQEAATRDPWEQPFFLVHDRVGVRVGSAGRDRVARTPDDLHSRPLRFPRS